MNYDVKECGRRIRQLRVQAGYTQQKIAEMLNVDRSSYSRVESGNNGCSVDLLVQLSKLFDVSIDYIVLGNAENDVSTLEYKAQLMRDIEKLVDQLEKFILRL